MRAWLYAYKNIYNLCPSPTLPPPPLYRKRGGGGGGVGVWVPKGCVPKMARQEFPNGKFPHDGHFGLGGGGGFGMTPWCDDLVCSRRRLLADRHSLPFPWTLSLRRRRCPSASHHPLTFLFLPALTFPLPFPFPSLGLSVRRPQCPSASHHSFPSHSLGQLCQRSPRTWSGGGCDLIKKQTNANQR